MKIDLTKKEVAKILEEKYGAGEFRVFYTESDREWEQRNNKSIKTSKEFPVKISYVLYFDDIN